MTPTDAPEGEGDLHERLEELEERHHQLFRRSEMDGDSLALADEMVICHLEGQPMRVLNDWVEALRVLEAEKAHLEASRGALAPHAVHPTGRAGGRAHTTA